MGLWRGLYIVFGNGIAICEKIMAVLLSGIVSLIESGFYFDVLRY